MVVGVVVVVSPEVVLEVGIGVPVEIVESVVAGVFIVVVEDVETQLRGTKQQ